MPAPFLCSEETNRGREEEERKKMGYLPYLSTETWTLLVAVITLIVVYAYWPYGVFKRIGVPGPKPIPFFGTMLAYKRGFTTFDMECFNKYGKTWGIYDGRQPVLCTTDVSLIKTVLIKECYSLFTNRRNFRVNGPLYDAVSIAEDDQWRRIRSVLSPSFTSGRLKEMFILMKQHSANLVRSITKRVDNNEDVLELKEFFGPYSMDVVTSTSLSVDIDSLNNPSDPFVTHIKKMLKFDLFQPIFLLIAFFPFLGPIFEKLEFSFIPTYVTDFFYASLKKIKANREASQNKSGRVDFLQLMIDSQRKDEESNGQEPMKGLTDHEVLSQAMILLFAGNETTSSSLGFLAYNLALNPEVMINLQQEIDATFPNKVCVPVPQHGDKDPVYVSPGARAAGGEGAPLSGTALPAAPHLPAQNHHSHNAAARGPHPGLWLPAALSHGHPQCSQLLSGQPTRGGVVRVPVRSERDLRPPARCGVCGQGSVGAEAGSGPAGQRRSRAPGGVGRQRQS
uniref:Cytochrome P450 3A n=1 Tax=Gadus morhua TaxID=8049 RepID=A0A8C4Z8R7_GADMO